MEFTKTIILKTRCIGTIQISRCDWSSHPSNDYHSSIATASFSIDRRYRCHTRRPRCSRPSENRPSNDSNPRQVLRLKENTADTTRSHSSLPTILLNLGLHTSPTSAPRKMQGLHAKNKTSSRSEINIQRKGKNNTDRYSGTREIQFNR